jgi:phthalate 4,5-cis-dihydrodiol dehydrogenase
MGCVAAKRLLAMTRLKFGIAGLGTAGLAFIPPLRARDDAELVAVADPDAAVAGQYGVAAYPALEAMLDHPGLDAVIVATPTMLHTRHAIAALEAGKHVVLEKPMATDLGDAQAILHAAGRCGRALLIGHSHSFDLPVQRMRAIIASGVLGRVRMIHSWAFTDWMYRPRRPDELDARQGGGVVMRQGAHQFDIIRLLGGGDLESVTAQTFDWDPARHGLGAHTALLRFASGAVASAVYNGYGGLGMAELTQGIGEWGFAEPPTVPSQRIPPSDVAAAKRSRANASDKSQAPFQPHFGQTVVSCERGDIRQSPNGLIVYSPAGREEIALPAGQIPHAMLLGEFLDGISGRRALLHDGRWGLANLEVCLAVVQSAKSGETVRLRHQYALEASR